MAVRLVSREFRDVRFGPLGNYCLGYGFNLVNEG